LLGAPLGVQVVHHRRYVVGVPVAGAEDDGLLLRAAGVAQVLEQVAAHRFHAVGKHNLGFVACGFVHGLQLAPVTGWPVVASIGLRAMMSSIVMPVSSRLTRPSLISQAAR
jgi:hypothetical protein